MSQLGNSILERCGLDRCGIARDACGIVLVAGKSFSTFAGPVSKPAESVSLSTNSAVVFESPPISPIVTVPAVATGLSESVATGLAVAKEPSSPSPSLPSLPSAPVFRDGELIGSCTNHGLLREVGSGMRGTPRRVRGPPRRIRGTRRRVTRSSPRAMGTRRRVEGGRRRVRGP